jgi:dihydroorotate dehydrogenase
MRLGLSSVFAGKDKNADSIGMNKRFGLDFKNPIGVAAGFDKNGLIVDRLAELGFGFVEVGTVTPKPQSGNPKPRIFRLPKDEALINRLGFNNDGARVVADRLRRIDRRCVVGVNIGKNRDVPNSQATADYIRCLDIIHDVADYITVNVSSPNTPNLRDLQQAENLEELIEALQRRNQELGPKPLLLKISPDLSESEIGSVVDISLRNKLAGIIATNTTISRDGLLTANIESIGAGGVSGKPLALRSTAAISSIYRHSNGKLPIVGVGGIFDAEDAFEKIAAGACLLQGYTGFVYGGPKFAQNLNEGLARIVSDRGFTNINQAIGSAHR